MMTSLRSYHGQGGGGLGSKPPPLLGGGETEKKEGEKMTYAVIYDTDIHGGLSGLIAVKSLMDVEEEVIRHYAHFERVPKGQEPLLPLTIPQFIAQSLPRIVVPGKSNIVLLDIPVNVMNPIEFINALASYRVRKHRVLYFDHHAHSESYTRELFEKGIETYIAGSSFEMSLMLPRILGVSQETMKELEEWALIGALSDFDVSIANRVSRELETLVLEYLDVFWKMHWGKYIQLNPEYGSVGSIIQSILDRNFSAREFLDWVRERSDTIPTPRYVVRGEVAQITSTVTPGLAWKSTWKVNMVAGTKVCVSYAETPRGISVIIASYWRYPEVFPIVDQVVQEVSRGRSVVGHSGAKSILVNSLDEAEMLTREIINMLNERLSQRFYLPKTVRLINDATVSAALHQDFQEILRRLSEVLEEQRRMYQEYLELKKKQVELLEKTQRHEFD